MMFQKSLHAVPSLRFLWPIPVLLALNALLSTLIGEFTFISGPGAFWKVPVRIGRRRWADGSIISRGVGCPMQKSNSRISVKKRRFLWH
jgi:hypothetical protein